jgi:hypothetical protein
MNKIMIAALGLLLSGMAGATLPPLSAEAQAKADAAKHKGEWSKKVAAYELCLTQNKVVERYLQKHDKPKPAADVPPCQNPGPYVPQQAQLSASQAQKKSGNQVR